MQHREWIGRIFCRKLTSWAMAALLPLYIIRDMFDLKFWPLAFLCIVCVVILLITILREHENIIVRKCSWINYIGRHTLDIYVLHYFFLPKGMPCLSLLVGENDINISIELLICSAVALVVIAISLAVSYLIGYSSFLQLLLLGKWEIKNS